MKKALSLALALMMLMSLCITPVMAAEPQGSASNPYYVANPQTAPGLVTIPANSTVYYQYKAAVFNGWEVGGYGLSAIIVDGVVYDQPDMWGEIYTTLKFNFVSPGIVGYVNNTDEDVEVMINHNEPVGTSNNPAEMVDGENSFTIPTNVFPYNAIYVPTVSGEYTFECAQSEDFGITLTIDGVEETLNGSLTLTLESYIPVMVSIAPMGVTPDVTITVTAPEAGTADNPIWLNSESVEETYVLGSTLYFSVDGALSGSTLVIDAACDHDLTVLVDGEKFIAKGGTLSLPLEAYEWYIELVISQDQDIENPLTLSIEYGEGSYENPIELVDGDNAISIPEGGYYYYSYTAETDGLLVITPADAAQFDLLDIGYEDDDFNYYYGYLPEGASSAMLPVPAGQTVVISACGAMDEETFINGAVETTLNVAVKDLLLYNTFEGADMMGDLEGWSSSSNLVLEEAGEESNVANGFYSAEFNVTQDWGNMYNFVNVEANTDYVVTLKAKGAKESTLWVKFNDNWGPDVAQADLAITTEWKEYTATINSGSCTNLVLLFQHAGYGADGQTIWLDDIIITKAEGGEQPDVPTDGNLIVNGDFEKGNASGWEIWQSTEISADAAHSGSYGAHLLGNGSWGGLLNQTMTVVPGQQYKLSFWINVNASGVNVQFTDGAGAAIEGAGGWFDAGKKDHLVEWTFTATDDSVKINFCGSGTGNAEDVYVDDLKLVELKAADSNGYVVNGGFETGDNTGWEFWQNTAVSADAAYNGSYGAHLQGDGGWGGLMNQTFAVESGKTYAITLWVNVLNGGVNLQISGADKVEGECDNTYMSTGELSGWTLCTFKVVANSNEIKLNFCGAGTGVAEDAYFDDIAVAETTISVPDVSFDGYIYNGDFETGDLTNWNNLWDGCGVTFVEGYESSNAINIVAGGWSQVRQDGIAVEPNTDYVLSAWVKANSNFGLMIKKGDDSGDIASVLPDASNEWKLVTLKFNSGDQSEICVLLIGWDGGGNATIDNVTLAVDEGGDTPIVPPVSDGIANGDFETGDNTGWEIWQGTAISGDAAHTGSYGAHLVGDGGWGGLLNQTFHVIPGQQYKLSFWVNVLSTGVNVQVTDGTGNFIEGAGDWLGANYTGQLVEWTFTATDDTVKINFCGSGTGSPEAAYVDSFVLSELKAPTSDGYVVNGTFETGDANGWETWQDTTVSADAAYNGSYGAHLVGNGGWGGLLNQTFAVEAGKAYSITLWVNVLNSGVNLQIAGADKVEGECDNTYMSTSELSGWTLCTFHVIANSDAITLNFCGGGTGVAEDAYVDDIAVTEITIKQPSYDGFIYDGDFEMGELDSWTNLYDGCDVSFVDGYNSNTAISIIAGSWSQVRQNAIAVEKNTNYVLTAWVKAATNFGIVVKNGDDSADVESYYIESASDWQQITLEFNSGDNDEICVLLIGWDGGGSAIIDDVTMAKGADPVPTYTPGDVNGDGRINNRDLGIVQQYLADWEPANMNELACDVNGDGRINNRDLGILQQYLADWDVELQYGKE